MDELEYSFSGGQYWSKYNHCRVWENKTYDVMIRDKYGQTSTAQIEVLNNQRRELLPPTVVWEDYTPLDWSPTSLVGHVTAENETDTIYSSTDNVSWYEIGTGSYTGTMNTSMDCLFKTKDIYGNESDITISDIRIDKSAPTNISFVPTVTVANDVITTVSAIEDHALPMKYSISYDGGQNWSDLQYGTKFGLHMPEKGTYSIVCRAYNAAGLYVEGTPVSLTIS